MFLDLKDLKKRGKDSESFYFEYTPETELVNIPSCKLVPPVKINGEISLTGEHSALVNAEIVFSVAGECTRCLKDTERTFSVVAEEDVSEDSETYTLINDKVDLDKIVQDAIIINTPVQFLCKDDCKGICSGCGVNLNDGKCKCEK